MTRLSPTSRPSNPPVQGGLGLPIAPRTLEERYGSLGAALLSVFPQATYLEAHLNARRESSALGYRPMVAAMSAIASGNARRSHLEGNTLQTPCAFRPPRAGKLPTPADSGPDRPTAAMPLPESRSEAAKVEERQARQVIATANEAKRDRKADLNDLALLPRLPAVAGYRDASGVWHRAPRSLHLSPATEAERQSALCSAGAVTRDFRPVTLAMAGSEGVDGIACSRGKLSTLAPTLGNAKSRRKECRKGMARKANP